MSSNVDYQSVRRACCELMGRGERPVRLNVQELLLTPEYLGHKGSNAVVQGYINDFWVEVGHRLNKPPRTVADVPDAFVAILDKALIDMIAAARKIAEDGLESQKTELAEQAQRMEHAIQAARDAATVAEQLRLRAEGERHVLQQRANELRADLESAAQKLSDASSRNDAQTRLIEEKDAEIRQQFMALENASRTLEQNNEQHRQETHRLMQQIDNERQEAHKERRRQNEQLDRLRNDIEAVRQELAIQREARVRLNVENDALTQRLHDAHARCQAAEEQSQQQQQILATLQIRHATVEEQRQAATLQLGVQQEEIAGLRQHIAQLQESVARLNNRPPEHTESAPGSLAAR